MVKKLIVAGLMLSLGIATFVACSADESAQEESGTLSSATLVTPSGNALSKPDSIVGSYLSEAGDGEILKLNDDGTFVAYTVTDMCSDTCSISMTETVKGRYTETATGVCTLAIETLAVKAEGMEEHPEEIEAYVDLLAGADAELRGMYTRLFEGETITGEEFWGAEQFANLCETDIIAEIDFENGTFAYQNTTE